MTKLTAREYEVDDFITIQLSEVELLNQIGQPIEEWGEYHRRHGMAVTVEDPAGEIVFCFGVHHKWTGVGEVWAVYSPLVQKYAMSLRLTQSFLKTLEEQFGYYRLYATVDIRFPETVRFVEKLGFEAEGLMRRHGPHGEDRMMYALVKENEDAG